MANEFKIKKGLIVTGADGGTVVDIQGSQGQLFSVTDDLSGSIFAVSDISGVPILDVNSSGTVTIDGLLTGDDATFSKRLTLNSPDYAQHLTMRRGIYGYDTIITGDRVDFSPTADTLNFKFLANLQTTGDVTVGGGDLTINSTGNAILNVNGTADSFVEKDTGTDLYFANNVSDKDIKFRVKDDGTNVIALTIDGSEGGNSTFAAQAFSAATSSGDASSTLTTKGYVDGLITGATIYRGAWDPSGGGYGSPDLSGVTQTSGYYYICSAAGTAEPNGTGTEPDTWDTGDWVIYNDVSGTGQWQKIDNSSVLSGVGTGQTVALWEGASSVTDSETLGNAPITVSGNNATFGGNIIAGGAVYPATNASASLGLSNKQWAGLDLSSSSAITWGNGDAEIIEGETNNYSLTFKTYDGTSNSAALRLDGDNTATFTGIVTGTSFSSSTDSGISINGITMTRVAANSAIRVSNGLETLGLLRSYAGLVVGTSATIGSSTQGNTLTISSAQGSRNTRFLSAGNGGYVQYESANDGIYGYIGSGSHLLSPVVNDNDFVLRAQGEFAVSIGATEKMRINSSGHVGIGTASPSVGLQLGNSTLGETKTAIFNSEGGGEIGLTIQSRTNRAKLRVADNDSNAYVVAEAGKAFFGTSANGDVNNITVLTNGNVGIGNTSPKAKLDVNGHFCVDSKTHTVTNAFTTCLTVNLNSHTGCHVVITVFGDWGSHSSAAYRGEFFLQNGANGYAEPGVILRQDDNTSNSTDQIICQILDPSSTSNPKNFEIQIRNTATSGTTSFTGQLTYTVQGKFNSIT